MEILEIKKLTSNAVMPIKAYDECAGYDLASVEDMQLLPHSSTLVKTDLAIHLPKNTYGRIVERSSLALLFICVGGGFIDVDYTGPIDVILFNHGNETFNINRGDRIAQLIIENICPVFSVKISE